MKTNITLFCARAAATLAFPLKRLPVALLMMLTTATGWADGISYLDATGTQQSCTTYTTVESSSTSWNSGWCVVNSNTTISDRITVSGTVNLILCDGATLTASKGITVGSDATLNIYAQTDDEATMGALMASGANDNQQYNAGIGGVDNTAAGTITINGGQINATGWCAAGIGSGGGTSTVGTITINGGIVTAQDNAHYGAGIGGGFNGGKAGTINLNGGVINAAGIGSGYFGGDCSITVNISDGVKKIVATPVQGGACIGKGKSASGSVTVNFISGGNIVTGDAKDAVFYDTGEGAQRQVRAKAMNHAITMSDDLKANITATSEYAFTGETVTLTLGTSVDATTLSVNDGAVATTDAGNRQYTFTMPDEDVTVTATLLQTYAVSLPANMEVVSATKAADADGKYITGTTVTFMASFPYAASNVSDGTSTLEPDANGIYTVTVADVDVTITATVERSATIDLSDANGDFNAIEGDVLTGSTSGTLTIADGAGITLSGATITGGIVCSGTATITLVGTNSTTGGYGKAGIQIGGSGTTLTINGDGTLTANGGTDAAGIGLNSAWDVTEDVVGGNIVINGGNITANGGGGGAGIGAGVTKDTNNSSSRKAIVGNITIAGGSVAAVGGSNADGIGAGENKYFATIQIGTVTIYDAIEMVDASSIKDFASVVYMHGETNVTASKTDYFTIIENGDRRIIVPKDDSDYTITIADGIEHGTLTVAETAKYMETVTVTATPAFGYRFVRLIVKDAQNNDVASTGNTFQMPKGGATVSAVFEQGTHGTTEFVWGYPGPDSFVNEATIYDGVTTVNIQNTEVRYIILKYDRYNYYNFLLDNDTDEATIPYAGGTGEFVSTNGTNFNVPYNGQTGYYDVTLTDVGNGKWGVSILKTVGVIDNIPDQTYSGSAITPEPLVLAGSLSLNKGTDYEYSYENNTNVGTATVTVTFKGDYASLGSVEKEFTIAPKPVTVTANNQTKEYGADDPTLTYTCDGLVGGDKLTGTLSREAGEDVGDYAINLGTLANSNYTLTLDVNGAKLSITPKPVTVSGITAVGKTYDGTAVATLNYESVSIDGRCGEDDLTVTATGTFADANAGEGKEVAISGITLGGTSAANYVLADEGQQASATASITKATPEAGDFVFSAPTDLSYDGSAKAATFSLVNKTGAGSITSSYYKAGVKVDAPVAAGTYTVKIDVAEGDNFAATTTALEDDSWTFTITGPAEGASINIALTEEYGTYCSAYDLDFSGATGLTAYIAAGYNKTEHTLLMVKVTSVPKGTGLLLKSTSTTGGNFTATVQPSPYVYSNLLTGTIAETDVTTNDLILGKSEIDNAIGFYRVRKPGKLAAGKAYLKDMAPTAGAPMLNLEFYDDATAIRANIREIAGGDQWYTLDGRKLQSKPTVKGLYILNGKKTVVR